MKIYSPVGVELLDIEPDEQSYRNRAILEIGSVVLYYSLPHHVELPVGAYIDFRGTRYTLRQPESFKMVHSEQYDYTVTLMAPEYGATIWMLINPIDHRLTFDLTATPREHLQIFVDNMNLRDSGWQIGECVDGVEKVITYDYTYCWDALKTMADTFHTEIEIQGKTVSLKMVEYRKNNPLPLCYGKGNGFKSGVGRGNDSSMPPVDRLYVQGGETNIDYSKYGSYIPNEGDPIGKDIFVHSNKLLLPRSVQYAFDGEKFEDEEGFVPANARHYATDRLGLYVDRTDGGRTATTEQAYDATAHYPRRVGTVTGVVTHAVKDGMVYDIQDNTIPYTLDYNDYWIADSKMTVIFQTGMLAGREFDVSKDGYKHYKDGFGGGVFELVSQEYDGMVMPNEEGGFLPVVGDEYIVVGCMLPDAYIRDDTAKTGAEWDMLRAAIRYRFDLEEYQYTFSGDIDEVWLHREWSQLGRRFRLGEYARFKDSRIGTDALLRMTQIKDYINRPWRIELTLSNAPTRTDLLDEIRRLSAQATRSGRSRMRVATVPQGIQTRFRFIAGPVDYTEVVPEITSTGRSVYDPESESFIMEETITIHGGYLIQHKAVLTDVTQMHLINGNTSTAQDRDQYTIEDATITLSGVDNSVLYLYAKEKIDHSGGWFEVVESKHEYRDGDYIWLYLGEFTPYYWDERTFKRRWHWLTLPDDTVTMSMELDNVAVDVVNLLHGLDQSVTEHTGEISIITNAYNTAATRINDLTTLLVSRLVSAINDFNSAQTAGGKDGNTIDFDTCIDDGTGLGTGGEGGTIHCKVFPDIAPINFLS